MASVTTQAIVHNNNISTDDDDIDSDAALIKATEAAQLSDTSTGHTKSMIPRPISNQSTKMEVASEENDFQLVQSKNRKRAGSPANDGSDDAASKRRVTNTTQKNVADSHQASNRVAEYNSDRMANTMYIKGISYNFASAIKRKPIQVQAKILKLCLSSDPKLWKTSGESLRMTNSKGSACYL